MPDATFRPPDLTTFTWLDELSRARGRNVAAMAETIRALDPTRPLHYEGDLSSADVDVYSRMYPPIEEIVLIARGEEDPLPDAAADSRRRAVPFVLCEYAHAMGNGPGGLTEQIDLVDGSERMMGAFVWEWIDHGIDTRTSDGTSFYGYGGDFGEELHDGTFIADGLLLPDRTPSPGLVELAAVYAPIARARGPPRGPPARLGWLLGLEQSVRPAGSAAPDDDTHRQESGARRGTRAPPGLVEGPPTIRGRDRGATRARVRGHRPPVDRRSALPRRPPARPCAQRDAGSASTLRSAASAARRANTASCRRQCSRLSRRTSVCNSRRIA